MSLDPPTSLVQVLTFGRKVEYTKIWRDRFSFAQLTFLLRWRSRKKTDVFYEFKNSQNRSYSSIKRISTNALSVFILHHHTNGLRNKNIRSVQDATHTSDPAAKKYKRVCEDFPNIAILTKSATPGKAQWTFSHAAVGNKFLGESVVSFSLAINLSSTSVIPLKI